MTEHWMRRIATLPSSLNACWLQVSANQGHARAEAVTAMAFRDGEGVPRNYPTAFSWAEKSAKQGDTVGEAVLGQLYKDGLGTPRNPQLSQYWESMANTQLSALRAQQQREQPSRQQPTQTAQNNGQHQMTQSEAEGIALFLLGMADAHPANSHRYSKEDIKAMTSPGECREAGGYWIETFTRGTGFMGGDDVKGWCDAP